jgi:sialic acid synthase SpsE
MTVQNPQKALDHAVSIARLNGAETKPEVILLHVIAEYPVSLSIGQCAQARLEKPWLFP